MVYSAGDDPECYPGTHILRNSANLTDQTALDEFELAMTLIRADEPWPDDQLDYPHYLCLHHHLFQDVYAWAGRLRTIRTGKAGNWFCYPEHIEREMHRIFGWLAEQEPIGRASIDDYREKATYLLSELNAIHPFRDGNGRTQMAFLALQAETKGYRFNDSALDPALVMEAMITSVSGNLVPLRRLVNRLII